MEKRTLAKREFIGEKQLDFIDDDKLVVLRAFKKTWSDGSSCLDIIKYIRTNTKLQVFYPVQHIQVSWPLATPFLSLFLKNDP